MMCKNLTNNWYDLYLTFKMLTYYEIYILMKIGLLNDVEILSH